MLTGKPCLYFRAELQVLRVFSEKGPYILSPPYSMVIITVLLPRLRLLFPPLLWLLQRLRPELLSIPMLLRLPRLLPPILLHLGLLRRLCWLLPILLQWGWWLLVPSLL